MRLRGKLLLIVAGAAAVFVAFASYAEQQVRATATERKKPLPGDDLIPDPIGAVNHAITKQPRPNRIRPLLLFGGA